MHQILSNMFSEKYNNRINEYITEKCKIDIIERYEKSSRFCTLNVFIKESIESIQEAISFSALMDSCGAYAKEEVLWCLHKMKQEHGFIISGDLLISKKNYTKDFMKLLGKKKLI